MSTNELTSAQENIFMGEDMNAKIPFQDCIEVQFSEEGNIEWFKLRKNLTKLAALKEELNIVELIKNFEYSISLLNQALFLKEKKEFKNSNSQTETPKPVLLSFLKQLLADFESYDGGEEEKEMIQDELAHFTEIDLLNAEVTKIKGNDDNLMTFKELMFSLFEYAKQKAISINYHKKETEGFAKALMQNEERLYKRSRSNSPRDNTQNYGLKKDTSRSMVIDMHNLPARYDQSNSQDTNRVNLKPQESREKIIAEIPLIISRGPESPPLKREGTLNFFSLIQKHSEINETGLLKNVENRAKYILPMMELADQSRNWRSEKKGRKKAISRIGIYVDQGISNRSIQRMPLRGAKTNNFGWQVVPNNTDKYTNTLGKNQTDNLTQLIEEEAQKTMQMLEMFMKLNQGTFKLEEQKVNLDELNEAQQEETKNSIEQLYAMTQDEETSSNSFDYNELELFGDMKEIYPSINYQSMKEVPRDKKLPFSKYVEQAMKYNNAERVSPNLEKNNEKDMFMAKLDSLRLKKNLQALNKGKHFQVRLKPLNQAKENQKKKMIKEINNGRIDDDGVPFVGKKNVPNKWHDYFYEYQLSLPAIEPKDQRRSLTTVKNKEIFESIK
jgi:hypothetical protein